MANKYKLRDLPLSIEDACLLEEAQETRSIRTIKPLLERYLIYSDGQSLATIPLSDIGIIINAIMERNGVSKTELKP